MGNRTYSPEFKLQVVLEALQSDGTDAEVARRLTTSIFSQSLRSEPACESTTGRLRRLLSEHELGLPRQVSKQSPSPVEKILKKAFGQLNLVAGLDPGPLIQAH